MSGRPLPIAAALLLLTALACATPPPSLGARAKGAVQGAIVGTVVGGLAAGPPGAAAGSAVFGLYGLVSGKSFYTGPNRHRGAPRQEELEREVEEELEGLEVRAAPEPR